MSSTTRVIVRKRAAGRPLGQGRHAEAVGLLAPEDATPGGQILREPGASRAVALEPEPDAVPQPAGRHGCPDDGDQTGAPGRGIVAAVEADGALRSLRDHLSPIAPGAGSPRMDDVRHRGKVDLPARRLETVGEVYLFGVEEERLVEPGDRLEGGAPDRQRRAQYPGHDTGPVVGRVDQQVA